MNGPSTVGLYEDAVRNMARDGQLFKALLNNLREHIDRFHEISSIVKDLGPTSVLDVGCSLGTIGSLLRWSYGPVKELVGLDWVDDCCIFCVEHMGYDRAVRGDAECYYPELHGNFDLVLCLEVLEHVVEPKAIVTNCLTWSKRWVLFSTPVEMGGIDGEFHVRKVTPEDLASWIKKTQIPIKYYKQHFLPSEFCEPHWQGWNFTLVEKA